MCDIGTKNSETTYYKNCIVDKELSLDAWKSFIDEVAQFKPAILISGIEPLLRTDLADFLNYTCIKKGLRCEVNTNGYLLLEKAKDLVDSGIDKLYISLDGPEEVHDRIRGTKGCFRKVVQGIEKIVALTNNKRKPKIRIFYTISNYNYEHLAPTLSIIEQLGIKDVLFTHLLFITDEMAETSNRLYPEFPTTSVNISQVYPEKIDTDILAEQIKLVKKNKKITVNFFPEMPFSKLNMYYRQPQKLMSDKRCLLAWNLASLKANGELAILPRCSDKNFGSITQRSFKELWNSDAYREFRVKLKKVGSYPACTRCCALFR